MQSGFLMSCAAVLALFADAACADTIYKCRNPQGKLVYQEAPCAQEAEAVSSWSAARQPQQDNDAGNVFDGVLVIPQRGKGHYFVDGSINGKPLTFVIDTGASSVVLPRSMAMMAGVYCRDQVQMQTVGGNVSGCMGVVARLRFGPFQVNNVPVAIAPNLSQPLLGMNVLQNLRIEQNGGEMRISAKK